MALAPYPELTNVVETKNDNNKFYEGADNGSVNGSDRGDGFKVYFSKIHKCEVSCILGENFYGLGGDEINDIHTYVKYVY